MMTVISDTGPLNYLILIGQADVLNTLYGGLTIPEKVAEELGHTRTPQIVKDWMAAKPSWLTIDATALTAFPQTTDLDPGEAAAITLALSQSADVFLSDDAAARTVA